MGTLFTPRCTRYWRTKEIEPFTGEKDYENVHILFVAKLRFDDKGGLLLLEGFKKAQRKNPRLLSCLSSVKSNTRTSSGLFPMWPSRGLYLGKNCNTCSTQLLYLPCLHQTNHGVRFTLKLLHIKRRFLDWTEIFCGKSPAIDNMVS